MELSSNKMMGNRLRSPVEVKIPEEVTEASRIDFGVVVTGYLHQSEMLDVSLVGRIFLDNEDRFANGRLIRTSDVSEFVERSGYLLAFTLTQSAYVLVCPGSVLSGLPRDEDRAHVAD